MSALPGQLILFGGEEPAEQPSPPAEPNCAACGGQPRACECCTTPGFAKQQAQQRAIAGHAADLERLVPIAKFLAKRAGASGITVGDVRLQAQREGLIAQHPEGRQLSYLTGLPRRAGLIPTGKRRMSPLPHSRNDHMIYTLPEYAERSS